MQTLKIVTLVLVIAVFVNHQIFAQCTKDTDCKGDRVCIDGECVEPGEKIEPTIMQKTILPKKSMGKFMVYLDPLGALFFGPHIGCEIGVGPNSFIDVHYRHSAFGLIYDAIATESFYYDMKMGSGAAGSGFKHYLAFRNLPHRLYLGGSFDFGWSGIKNVDEDYPNEKWETFANLLFFAGHAGWLWRFDGPFNLGLGLLFGVAIEVKDEKEYAPGYPEEDKEPPEKSVYPGGGLQLLLNFEFGK